MRGDYSDVDFVVNESEIGTAFHAVGCITDDAVRDVKNMFIELCNFSF